MKAFKSILLVLAAAIAATSLAACGGDNEGGRPTGGNGSIVIKYYDGGYGREWADDLASRYKTIHPDADVTMEADLEILGTMTSALQSEDPDYDIFISHDITWQYYALEGYLANLDALYAKKLSDGRTFADALSPANREYSKFDAGEGEHYYKVNWTQGAGGLIYNVDMFEEYGWEVPETYDDLKNLCAQIVSEARPVKGGMGGQTVVPFTWTNENEYLWDYVVFEWWAQLAGTEKISQLLQYDKANNYTNGFESFNPDTNYKEFKQAYQYWYDLVAKNPNYSVSASNAQTKLAAQGQFLRGEAAMMPYSHWAYYELKKANGGDDIGFEVNLMETPLVKGTQRYNYLVGFGDSIVVSKYCHNMDLAIDFISFMAEPESLVSFTEKSQGAFSAFDYSVLPAEQLARLNSNPFVASVNKKLTTETNFNLYSNEPIAYLTSATVQPWLANKYHYVPAFAGKGTTDNPDDVFAEMYSTAKANWRSWLYNAGLV